MTRIIVRPVTSRRERRIFLRFPWRIYQDDPLWVPPILSQRAARIQPEDNPFLQQGEMEAFIAWQDGEPVGTIAPAVDHQLNQRLDRQVAVFGFFESIQAYPVAEALLDRAAAWARERGLQTLRGPQSFGSSDEPGLLIEGRRTPPGLLMGWSPPYYVDFVERYGFRKYRDALAYRAYLANYVDEAGKVRIPEKIQRVAEYVRRRYGYRIRPGNLAAWDQELEVARQIYNRSLGTLPEFVPMDEAEWKRFASQLRPLLDPELVAFAEAEGKPVGFGLALPDINQALRHCNGLQNPWDYVKLWWHSRRLPGASFKILALLPEYWGRGLDALIYLQIAQATIRKGYEWLDLSLTGEDNPMTNKLATRLGAQLDKRYRVYDLPL